jgi:3-oxoacyl-[acyl-carrier protein] reductase
MKLKGKIALVTGAAQGIGAAVARELAGQGARVILTDVLHEKLEEQIYQLKKEGKDAMAVAMDVGKEEQVIDTFQQIKETYGQLDILVNNAGISPKVDGKRRSSKDIPLEEWNQVMQINLTGVFLCTREALPLMINKGWGRIITLSSQAGRTSSRIAGAHYAATKSGVIGFTRTIAAEYGKHGVTANCIAPGRIDTPMANGASGDQNEKFLGLVPAGRVGTPDEVGQLIAFLASEEAGYITGTTVDINGGMFMG